MSRSKGSSSTARSKIRPLPKEVVDRIAAGEVVQRPVSVVKELLENSLDADATQIDISCQRGGLDSIIVTDNGFGIHQRDLPLACTRFATSKLSTVDDLKSIRTFGFRGEALASASMVARVTITSRVRPRPRNDKNCNSTVNNSNGDGASLLLVNEKNDGEVSDDDDLTHNNCAFKMQYKDGSFCSTSNPNGKARPSAGKEGTVIQVVDLFYNIPSRRRALEGRKNERDEYERTLSVTQQYAIHEAKRGVGFLCRDKSSGKKIGNHADLNTQSLASIKKLQNERKRTAQFSSEDDQLLATKEVIGHVFGTAVTRELLPFKAGEGDVDAVSALALKAMREGNNGSTTTAESNNDDLLAEMMMSGGESQSASTQSSASKFAFAYRATGLITNGSYSAPKSSAAFILFINDRLVESSSLRRAVESIYTDTLPKGGRPFVYISLDLPGPHIDVNVHPTKREVAFLHEDRLCDAVAAAVRECIGSATASRTFEVKKSGALFDGGTMKDSTAAAVIMSKKSLTDLTKSSSLSSKADCDIDDEKDGEEEGDQGEAINDHTNIVGKTPRKRIPEESKTTSTAKKPYDPSRLVRTNRAAPAGALEAFLYKKETVNKNEKCTEESEPKMQENEQTIQHESQCPHYGKKQLDLSVPGAFASAICRCQVQRSELLPPASNNVVVRNNLNSKVVLKKIIPTECNYDSICNLRNEITSHNHQELNETLRASTFVGVVSRCRSLIQCGVDLLMINHRELACEMFYQVALMKFKGMKMAKLGGDGVDVISVVGQRLQFEEITDSIDVIENVEKIPLSKVTSTNADLAYEVTKCLSEKAAMLEEYFSIKFEKRKVSKQQRQRSSLFITGLPILLDGHVPQPHALPLFLIRLATKVDWSDEQPCFNAVCREIAFFYAEPPFSSSSDDESYKSENSDFIDDESKKYVRHILFPAISFLLVPPQRLANDGAVMKLASLNSLYKVFERC